jgi:hypothetical protein
LKNKKYKGIKGNYTFNSFLFVEIQSLCCCELPLPKGNSGFKTPTPQLMLTAPLDFCLASESVPDTDLQVRHPHGSFCAAKVILFLNSTLKGSGFYRNFFG